jgi:hypothetical protein
MSGHDCLAMAAIHFVGPADEFSSSHGKKFNHNVGLYDVAYVTAGHDGNTKLNLDRLLTVANKWHPDENNDRSFSLFNMSIWFC